MWCFCDITGRNRPVLSLHRPVLSLHHSVTPRSESTTGAPPHLWVGAAHVLPQKGDEFASSGRKLALPRGKQHTLDFLFHQVTDPKFHNETRSTKCFYPAVLRLPRCGCALALTSAEFVAHRILSFVIRRHAAVQIEYIIYVLELGGSSYYVQNDL